MTDGKQTEIRAKLQQLQDVLAGCLDICLVLINGQAVETTIPSGYPLHCFRAEATGCNCHRDLLEMLRKQSAVDPVHYKCPHGFHVALLPTAIAPASNQLYLIAGKTGNQNKLKTSLKMLQAVYDLPLDWSRRSRPAAQSGNPKRIEKSPAALTQQERVILALITSGYSNKSIADKLCISLSTVKSHVAHILHKLNLKNRTEAGIYALENNLTLLGAVPDELAK